MVPMILDTDIGDDIDDSWALAYLLCRPEVELKLIVTAYGDRERHLQRASVIRKILRAAGRMVPIAIGRESWGCAGASRPNCAQAPWAADCMDGEVIQDGITEMAKILQSSVEPVTVLAIAPLCNVLALIQQEGPGIVAGHNLVGMHGSIYRGYGGSEEVHAEHNVACDPLACRASLEAPWHSVTLSPLDTCGLIQLRGTEYKAVLESASPVAQTLIATYRAWAGLSCVAGKYKGLDVEAHSTRLFDAVAAHLAICPDGGGLMEVRRCSLKVTEEGFTVPEQEGGVEVYCALEWLDEGITLFEALLAESIASSSSAEHRAVQTVVSSEAAAVCLKCNEADIEYKAAPCGHPLFCKKCAMKLATGGKCKICGGMFMSLKRMNRL